MKTNTVIIGLVLAAIAIGAGIYLIYGNDAEEITVEIELRTDIYSADTDRGPVVGAKINITFTSTKETTVYSGLPDIVFEKDGERRVFSSQNVSRWISGQSVPMYMEYGTGTLFNPKGWEYHFELSDYMKRTGNFKIIEATI